VTFSPPPKKKLEGAALEDSRVWVRNNPDGVAARAPLATFRFPFCGRLRGEGS
jgi:hypothetical protein